ncbi:MAG: GGDEF domain-containing protein [Methylococcaceae bacterium]|nr:GGDEF domain-containing protein [Methylococcaceae bacterium]
MKLRRSAIKTGNTAEFKRRLLEKSLAMHAQAYQAQIKAKLLTQAIMQIENSKKYLQTLNDTLANEITTRIQIEKKIQYMASHDDLTGLPNRALFRDRLEMAQNMALRNKAKLAILFIDLDGFKVVNDNYGHKVGDLLLQEVAKLLQATVRQSDSVARIGGDEFIILLNGVIDKLDAVVVAEKILAAFRQPILLAGQSAKVGASIGISIFPDHSSDTEKLIVYADDAMYEIKKSGKNAYAFHPLLTQQ